MLTQSGLDEWHLPICYQNPPFSWENASIKSGMCCFSVVPLIENSDGWASYRFCLFFVDFPFWMRLGVRYHCYYLYSVVCQQIWCNVLPLFFPRYTGVKKRPNTINFLFQILLFYFEELKKQQQQHNRTYSERPPYRRTSGKNNVCKN